MRLGLGLVEVAEISEPQNQAFRSGDMNWLIEEQLLLPGEAAHHDAILSVARHAGQRVNRLPPKLPAQDGAARRQKG